MKNENKFLSKNLKAYSALASALVGATGFANAQVIYSDVVPDRYVSGEDYWIDTYELDLNNDGIVDFILGSKNTIHDNYCSESNSIYIDPVSTNGIAIANYDVKVIEAGDIIDDESEWSWIYKKRLASHYDKVTCWGGSGSTWTWSSGDWLDQYEKFIGLRFKLNDHNHYGWVRLSTSYSGIFVYDYAYEAAPETAITAGCSDVIVYADADTDGHGDISSSTVVSDCAIPTGFVKDATDCNDANDAIHPGAIETNNDIDDNCNGIIDEGICNSPANLLTNNITQDAATLSWDADDGALSYKLRYKIAGSEIWTKLKTTNTSYTIDGLAGNTKYVWQVRSKCGAQPKVTSEWTEKEFFTTAPQRLAAEEIKPSVNAYPNPFTNSVTISLSLSKATHALIELYDLAGRKLLRIIDEDLSEGNHIVQMQRGQLIAGIYFLQVKMGDQLVVKKLVVE